MPDNLSNINYLTLSFMKNGTFIVEFRPLNVKYKMVSYMGMIKLYNIPSNTYVRTISKAEFDEFYIIRETLTPDNRYDIDWMVNGKLQERIRLNANYAVTKWKMAELAKSTHTVGKLIPRRVI